ncbi:25823_t:CDS:10 [Gigaspora rosea]|nr:25823_t:CDS:10 [Gigaspora rosea]
MSDIIREPRLEATKFFKYQIDKNAYCIYEFFKRVPASQWSLSAFVKYVAKLETGLDFEQLFKVFVESLDQFCVLFVVPGCVRAFAQSYLKWLEAMVNECREYFLAKMTLQEKTKLKDVFKDTVNVTAQAEAYRAYITAPAVPTKSSGTDVQERHNDKVDEELIEASKEKKRKDENDVTVVTSTPPTKRSRSRYESSYSPSPSEVEELPSLATDSVFNDDNDDYSEENKKPIIEDLSDDYSKENEKPIIEDQNNVISPLCAVQETSENEIVVFFTQQKMSSHLSQISTISTANETEVKSTCNDNDEESSSSPPNQELEDTKTIPSIIVNKVNEQDGDIMTDTKIMHDRYLRIRQDLCDYSSQKDWFIEDYNVSDGFRKYQISNINKLVAGETFNFASSNEAIYIDDERKWHISIRQPRQQTPPSFLREIMDEYEAKINDIDELRSKFHNMWRKYHDKVIYLDSERRLFEAIQAVAHAFFERMHMYPDSRNKNEDTANTESLSLRKHQEETCKVEREEACFVEAKHLSDTRNNKIGGYNLYKVAILCQGGINRIIYSRGNTPKLKSFGGYICEGYIYLGMMDLEYDGIYRYFQLSEIKLAQKLSEFNLVRKLIIETFYFKCRIDSFYSSENNKRLSSNISCHNSFSREPTIIPKACRSTMIPVVSLIEKTTKTNNWKKTKIFSYQVNICQEMISKFNEALGFLFHKKYKMDFVGLTKDEKDYVIAEILKRKIYITDCQTSSISGDKFNLSLYAYPTEKYRFWKINLTGQACPALPSE